MNVMIVNRKGKAVAIGNNMEPVIVEGTGSFIGMKAINKILETVPVEASETYHFYIPDMLQGIIGGASIEYVKSGKTGTGTQLTAEEINDFKEFYKLYAERILNIRFSLAKYTKDANIIALRTKAWNLLSSTASTVTPVQTTIDPDKALREAFDKSMLEAINKGDMSLYATLKAERDKLKAPEVITTVNTPVANKVEYNASMWDQPTEEIKPTGTEANTTASDENIAEEADGDIAW